MHHLVSKKRKTKEQPETIPEERTAEEETWIAPILCRDGVTRSLVQCGKAFSSLRRAEGEYDSTFDRHDSNSSFFDRTEDQLIDDSTIEVEDPTTATAEAADASEGTESAYSPRAIQAEVDALEEDWEQDNQNDVTGEENNLPPVFPDQSLLTVSQCAEAMDQPSEIEVDVTVEELNPDAL